MDSPSMGNCDFCSKEVDLLIKCSQCSAFFCKEHRQPDNHNCSEGKNPVRNTEKEVTPIKTTEKEGKPAPKDNQEQTFPPEIPKMLPVLILLILNVSALSLIYFKAYDFGYDAAYYIKYSEGESLGYQTGYTLGFKEGYSMGNATGYETGYLNGYDYGETTGYQQGYIDGETVGENMGFVEGKNTAFQEYYQYGMDDIKNKTYNISYPTYSKVSSFLKQDETDIEWYIAGTFVYSDFAQTVKDNAFKKGIHCYYVYLDFVTPPGHPIVAFNTTDRGLVFVDPRTDERMIVEIGIRYWRDNGFYANRDDTITKIEMVW